MVPVNMCTLKLALVGLLALCKTLGEKRKERLVYNATQTVCLVLCVVLENERKKKKPCDQKIQINISTCKPTASPWLPSQKNMITPPSPQ